MDGIEITIPIGPQSHLSPGALACDLRFWLLLVTGKLLTWSQQLVLSTVDNIHSPLGYKNYSYCDAFQRWGLRLTPSLPEGDPFSPQVVPPKKNIFNTLNVAFAQANKLVAVAGESNDFVGIRRRLSGART